jgi:transposase, IS5 family
MRQRFDQQLNLGVHPIPEVKFPLKSRDELPPILRGLQYIFITPSLNEKVFALLEEKVCKGKKKTGRKGMDLWHILVLAVVRHGLNTNWDRLESMANYDALVRMVLGVHTTSFGAPQMEFTYQSIIDNVGQIDEALLRSINQLVVGAGHELLKKKGQAETVLELKTDSYALETDVHFPTDLNLLWDSARKCLDTVEALQGETSLPGWRKIKHIRKTIKSKFRKASHQVFAGKNETQKKEAVKGYLQQGAILLERCGQIEKAVSVHSPKVATLLLALHSYMDYVKKFSAQIERRLLKGESIPSEEKIYSIFEPHTEWINKGKKNKPVELGHLLLITTDQHQFIIDTKIMEGEKDVSQIKPLQERLNKNFGSAQIASHSFDKGFWSKDNLEALTATGTIKQVVLPKRGRHSKEDKERESQKGFKAKRNAHSAVESNINMLEHHGLNRCLDKGLHGYKRCVGLSVLAYNLHILGNVLQCQDRQRADKEKPALRQAA